MPGKNALFEVCFQLLTKFPSPLPSSFENTERPEFVEGEIPGSPPPDLRNWKRKMLRRRFGVAACPGRFTASFALSFAKHKLRRRELACPVRRGSAPRRVRNDISGLLGEALRFHLLNFECVLRREGNFFVTTDFHKILK